MEKYIVNKFGKDIAQMIFTLGENYLGLSEQLGSSFGMSAEARMTALTYALKLNRDIVINKQKNEVLDMLMQIQGNEPGAEIPDEDDEDEEDLDFTKGL